MNQEESELWGLAVHAVLSGRDNVTRGGGELRPHAGVGVAAAQIADEVVEEYRKRKSQKE